MWANVFRDEPLVAAIAPGLEPFRAYLHGIADTLADGWAAAAGTPASSARRRATR